MPVKQVVQFMEIEEVGLQVRHCLTVSQGIQLIKEIQIMPANNLKQLLKHVWRQGSYFATMQRDIKRQHSGIKQPLQHLLQRVYGPACIQLQSCGIGLVTQITVTTGKVATEGGHIQQMDMPGKLPDGRAIFSR